MQMLCLTLALLVTGCGFMVSEKDARQAASKAGLTQVKVLSSHQVFPNYFGCGEGMTRASRSWGSIPRATR